MEAIISAALLLFLVLDPIGNIPLFMVVLKDIDTERQQKIIVREALFGLVFLLLFLFLGRYILVLLNISQDSLSIAGGIILFLIAIKMIFSQSEDMFKSTLGHDPFIVPLAVPLIAGPSAMATVMLMMAREPEKWTSWLAAVVIAWFISAVILYLANRLSPLIGKRGLTAIERLMGMILTTIAIEMLLSGIRHSFFHA